MKRLQVDEAMAASLTSPTIPINHALNLQTLTLESSSSSKKSEDNPEVFRVYFKGLLTDERVTSSNEVVKMAGIGVSICNSKDEMIFEMKKHLDLSKCDGMSKQGVEGKALLEALNAAIDLKLKRVVFYCDYYPLYQFVSRRWRPKQQKIINFVDLVNLLRKSFTYCEHSLIARKDVKFAFKLAREAISSQISKVVSTQEKLQSCVICLDDKSVDQFFSIEGCTHRYCYSCVKQHVEVKLHTGVLPKCPHEGCGNEYRFESCEKFLNPKFTEMMRQLLKEDSIPVTEKVYCSYPKCSALMSKTEVLGLTNDTGAITCYKCHGDFCINCRVPWHKNMNCAEYKRRNPTPLVEESNFKNLAARNLWRQCMKCKHMIELAAGCYHMTCRCGYEFCYTCGAEWKNKKATCNCPLWDEGNIVDAVEENHVNDAFYGFADYDFEGYVSEDDYYDDFVLDDDDYFEHDVPEDDYFLHDAVLEDDVALHDDDFEHDLVPEDVLEDVYGDFEHDVPEDDVLEDVYGDFEQDVPEYDEYGDCEHDVREDDVLVDDVCEHDVLEDDVREDDVLEHDVREDDVPEDDVLEHDVPEDDALEHDVPEDDVLEDDVPEDAYGEFEHDVPEYDEYGDFEHDVPEYDDYGDFEPDFVEDEYDEFW